MNHNSQNDPVCSNVLLGFSQTDTIGRFGCTITSISNLLNLTPLQVNDALKTPGLDGFVQEDLVSWVNLNRCLPQLKFITKQPFDNEKVLAVIAREGACLVEVSVKGGSHWPLYIGNHYLLDPWDGQIHPTAYYPNVINYVETQRLMPLPAPQPVPDPVPPAPTPPTMTADQRNALGVLQGLLLTLKDPSDPTGNRFMFTTVEGAARWIPDAVKTIYTLQQQPTPEPVFKNALATTLYRLAKQIG